MKEFKQFKWVPDGVYDYSEYLCRYVIVNGNSTVVINKMWVDSGGPDGIYPKLQQPWGTFPDFPAKQKS